MASRKSLGEKIAMLIKASKKSQAEVAEQVALPASQLNRFFKGHSAITSSNLSAVLAELGIDLDEIVSAKIRKSGEIDDEKIETTEDCVRFLFRNLDELGRQTYLNNLAWAAKVSSKKALPPRVQEILKTEMTLI